MTTGWKKNARKQVYTEFKNDDYYSYFTEAKIVFPKILILNMDAYIKDRILEDRTILIFLNLLAH